MQKKQIFQKWFSFSLCEKLLALKQLLNLTIFLGKTITCILEDFVVKLRAPTTLIKIKLSGIKDFILGKQSVDSSQNRNVIGILFSSKITQKFIRWYTTLYRATQVVFSPSLDMLLTSFSFVSDCLFVYSHLLLLTRNTFELLDRAVWWRWW